MKEIIVTVKLYGQKRTKKIRLMQGAKIADLLKRLNYNPDVVAVRCNKKIVPEEERLANGDIVEIIPIVTGG
jgi:sulfur carrier protein